MSYKAYAFRLRTGQDVADLDKYVSGMDGVAFLEFFYMPGKSHQGFQAVATDLVAAITVDRGDLAESLRDEGGIERSNYFTRLENLPVEEGEEAGKVKGWDVIPAPSEEVMARGWAEWAKAYLKEKGTQ
tara:strand:- start:16 stop:402 length:387 start_codon:yes stop_codon:yes gene_type:complete